jgi:hypothetical protein
MSAPTEQDVVKVVLPAHVDPRDLQTSDALWRRIEKAAAKAVFKQAGLDGLAKAYTVHVLRFVESGPGTVLAQRTIQHGKLSRYTL